MLGFDTIRSWAIVAAIGTSVAACTGTSSVQPVTFGGSYTPRILDYAASKGGMLTEVVGNPFRAAKEDVDVVVVNAMQRAHFGPKILFFTKAPKDFTSPYRVVVAFNPTSGVDAYRLCSGEVGTRAQTSAQPSRVLAALCARERVITTTSGIIAGPQGPNDPGFVKVMEQISLTLFPPYDPDLRQPNWDI